MTHRTRHLMRRGARATAAGLLCGLTVGCAAPQAQVADAGEVYDPLEPVNRVIFDFNTAVDDVILEPVARGYAEIVPPPLQDGVTNFLRNLRTPVIFANEVLQGDWDGAENAAARFFINSIAGVGGLVDIAEMNGYAFQDEDFGQTLAVWGVEEGPYLVIPFLGPSNFRDAVGTAVDAYANPFDIIAEQHEDGIWFVVGRGILSAIDARARNLDTIEDIRASSLDYYASVRSIYQQFRNAQIRDSEAEAEASSDAPGADEFITPGAPSGSGDLPGADDFVSP
ncbi:MAG: VacJ family lipoprotein [Pseudomonadota bacterium]